MSHDSRDDAHTRTCLAAVGEVLMVGFIVACSVAAVSLTGAAAVKYCLGPGGGGEAAAISASAAGRGASSVVATPVGGILLRALAATTGRQET